jgi:hypothetical protein
VVSCDFEFVSVKIFGSVVRCARKADPFRTSDGKAASWQFNIDAFCFSATSPYNFLALENLNHNLPESGPTAFSLKPEGKGARAWRFI